jgi:hypothetical protein
LLSLPAAAATFGDLHETPDDQERADADERGAAVGARLRSTA